VTLPTGMPRGNSDSTRDERKPEVTTVVPALTRLPFSTKSSRSFLGLPTSGWTMPLAPSGTIWAETALEASVISVTSAVPPVTLVTLPASPPEAITGWSTRTPSLEPRSIFTVEYQTVGERAITRPVTGLVP
jgi:hypothetical protein